MELAAQAKTLFAGDPDDENGKSDQGREPLYKMENPISGHPLASEGAEAEG